MSRQHKHNLNHNYNLMGFDTIEINLVIIIINFIIYYALVIINYQITMIINYIAMG